MSRYKKYITAGATFSVALSVGFAMQYGDAIAARWGADAPVGGPGTQLDDVEELITPVSASLAVTTNLPSPQPTFAPVELTSASSIPMEMSTPTLLTDDFSTPVSASADDLGLEPLSPVAEPEPVRARFLQAVLPNGGITGFLPDAIVEAAVRGEDIGVAAPDTPILTAPCDITLTAVPTELAFVDLTLESPCRPDSVVSIHHQGMMFNDITDSGGLLRVSVPALKEEAFFIAAFDDGEGAVAMTGVPDLVNFDRAVLQWQGEDDVQLHALEFGATYGDPGHIWSETSGAMEHAKTGQGGVLVRLGNESVPEALMAEVYTYPTGITSRDGSIHLTVEAEVTTRNCGREVAAQSIQVGMDGEADAVDLDMTMPGCEATGEFLVLKNMFEDLTLAAK